MARLPRPSVARRQRPMSIRRSRKSSPSPPPRASPRRAAEAAPEVSGDGSVAVGRGDADGSRAYTAAEVESVGIIVGYVARGEHHRMLVEHIVRKERDVVAAPAQPRTKLQVFGLRQAG